MKYDVNVTRDGKWWMVHIPAIDGLTQARRVSDVEDEARSYIAVTTDVALSSVELGEVRVEAPVVGDVGVVLADIQSTRVQAAELEAHASEQTRSLVNTLIKADVPIRDIGSLLGVSYQRVAQLAQPRPRE